MDVERSIQNILLDHQQLLALVRKAFPHCQKLDGWKMLSGGALNTTYQFQIGFDTFVLRIYARDRAHCKTEKIIYKLIDRDVATPKLMILMNHGLIPFLNLLPGSMYLKSHQN